MGKGFGVRMLGFVDEGARRPPIALPDGALMCFTIDIAFEAFLEASQHRGGLPVPKGVPDLYSLSFAEYGLRVGIWRLLDLMAEHGLKAGILANGLAAERYPSTLRAVADAGHEMIAHGWANDAEVPSEDPAAEARMVRRTAEAIAAATGRVPRGWLSPGYIGSRALRRALAEAGFLYCCDDAADDVPYVVEIGARPLVMMPRTSFGSNDLATWFAPRHAPATWRSSFRSQAEAIHAEARRGRPGWMELVLHAQFAGRLQAALEVGDMIRHAMALEGVWTATRGELAQWCLEQWRKSGQSR